jgi:hypothetical protein
VATHRNGRNPTVREGVGIYANRCDKALAANNPALTLGVLPLSNGQLNGRNPTVREGVGIYANRYDKELAANNPALTLGVAAIELRPIADPRP